MLTPKRKPQKLGPKQSKWLRMLESGKFKQAHYTLFDGAGYCCMGLACVSVGLKPSSDHRFGDEDAIAPRAVCTALQLHSPVGLRKDGAEQLTALNDDGTRFRTIAKLIRAEPEQYFKKPA